MEYYLSQICPMYGLSVKTISSLPQWLEDKKNEGKSLGIFTEHGFEINFSEQNASRFKKWNGDVTPQNPVSPFFVQAIHTIWNAMECFIQGELDYLVMGDEVIEFPQLAKKIYQAMSGMSESVVITDKENSGLMGLTESDLLEISHDAFLSNLYGKFQSLSGCFSEAGKYFRMAAETSPDFAESYSNLGTLLWSHRQKRDAFLLFIESIFRNPHLTTAQLNFFDAGYELKEFSAMAKVIEEVLPRVGDIPEMKHHLAICYQKTGRNAQAIDILNDILKKNALDTEAHMILDEINKEENQQGV